MIAQRDLCSDSGAFAGAWLVGQITAVSDRTRKTVEYANVLEELFGVPALARSQGPVLVEATANGLVYCKVYSITDTGTLAVPPSAYSSSSV